MVILLNMPLPQPVSLHVYFLLPIAHRIKDAVLVGRQQRAEGATRSCWLF